MATDTEDTDWLSTDARLRWQRLKGRLFVGVLVLATLVGVLALAALFAYIGRDALGPFGAEPSWFLLYFGTAVTPIAAYTLYVTGRLRWLGDPHPDVRTVNDTAFAVVFGSLVLGLVVYAVATALAPEDVAIYVVCLSVPPLLVRGYARRYGETHFTGPGTPVSVLFGLGAGVVVAVTLGETLALLVDWLLFLVVVTLPAAALLGSLAVRRFSRRWGYLTSAAVLVLGPAGAIGGIVAGFDPALGVVLASGVLAPVGLLVADTVAHRRGGWPGLLGPVVLIGGVLVGATLERSLGITGLNSWLTPTLVFDSWSSTDPTAAGIYPQLVGSIIIVAVMAVMSFPVGVGAAIYLEEYAPETGWGGRLATVLDVNISNLAGVPSVVYGLLGLALFRNAFGLAPGLVITAGATLGLLILPIVIVAAQEALRSVPDELRQGSYGLGASRWQTVRNVVLPEALPGMLTGTILALGRAIGETAPLVMIGVAATRFSPPEGLFSGATALPLQIFASAGNAIPEYRTGVLAAASLVLLVTLLAMNATAILVRNRYENN